MRHKRRKKQTGGVFLQDTKEHRPLLAGLVRGLFLVLALAMLTLLPVPRAAAAESQPRMVIPLGQAVGIKLFSQGVLVVGLTDITTQQGLASPAKACGIRTGDVITHINDTRVSSIEEVQTILQDLNGREMDLNVLRAEEELELTTRAAQCSADGAYKLGAWIRDSMAGIGTLTFVEPATGLFGTLGHGINDVDTAVLMKLQTGAITPASVVGVVKGEDGRPGELRGAFTAGEDLGNLFANTQQGVFGYLTENDTFTGTPIPAAKPEEVQEGKATILSTVDGTQVEEYTVEITKICRNATDTRDLMLKVTDQRLLDRTGGIVQGMSGSPIIQDGKLVGAVTHVLVNDPTRGYGIFIENMLDAAG